MSIEKVKYMNIKRNVKRKSKIHEYQKKCHTKKKKYLNNKIDFKQVKIYKKPRQNFEDTIH